MVMSFMVMPLDTGATRFTDTLSTRLGPAPPVDELENLFEKHASIFCCSWFKREDLNFHEVPAQGKKQW